MPTTFNALVDLPTSASIEELIQLFKGGSSHWINANDLLAGKFGWGRGYGAFSVSESNIQKIAAYITGQEEHHPVRHSPKSYKNSSSDTDSSGEMSKPLKRLARC